MRFVAHVVRDWIARLRETGLATQSAVLLLAVAAAYALVAPVSSLASGTSGLLAAAVAAGLCWLGAEAAMALRWLCRGTRYALWGSMGGMLPRMGIPVAWGLVLQIRSSVLAEGGLLLYLIAFYPVTLAVETLLSLPGGGAAGHDSDIPRTR